MLISFTKSFLQLYNLCGFSPSNSFDAGKRLIASTLNGYHCLVFTVCDYCYHFPNDYTTNCTGPTTKPQMFV